MTYRTKDQNTYVHGDWNAICDVCGFKFKASDLRKRWDGFMVCRDDWEPRHPMDLFEGTPDRQSTPWSRTEGTVVESGPDYADDPNGTIPSGSFTTDTGTIEKFTA